MNLEEIYAELSRLGWRVSALETLECVLDIGAQTVVRDTQQSTTSTSYVDITSMSLTTTKKANLLVVYTDCMQHASAGQNTYVRLVQDGVSVHEAVFVSQGAGYGTIVTIHAVLLSVAAGAVIKAQMKCDSGTIYSNTQNSAAGRSRLSIVELYK